MTAQRDRFESLIAEIDAVLEESGPRLPWVMSNDVQQQRQMLVRARELLSELQQLPAAASEATGQNISPTAPPSGTGPTAQASSQVLQALLQEMQYLRGQTMQILDPLRNEVHTLKQQRELLLREVQQLQQQRLQLDQGVSPSPSTGQWEAMLHQLTSHLESYLAQQLQQSVRRLETSTANTYLLTQSAAGHPPDGADLTPTQRLEYLKQIQAQSDQLVMNLDRVLRTVFDSLQQSIYSYQDSLGHGLNKMHTLGQQGEMMFNALINHLAQQMNQETLAYLESDQTRTPHPRQLPNGADSQPPGNIARNELTSPGLQSDQSDELYSGEADLDLDDLDLDLGTGEAEVTLSQIDNEISQLQLDMNELAAAYDPTRDSDENVEASQGMAPSPDTDQPPPAKNFDPLEVLDRLEEAAPNPDPSVSLPESSPMGTLEATTVANDADTDAENALDDLYQSIFGDVLAANMPRVSSEENQTGQAGDEMISSDSPSLNEDVGAPSTTAPFNRDELQSDISETAPETGLELAAGIDDIAALMGLGKTDGAESEPEASADIEQTFVSQASLDQLFGDGTAEQLTDSTAEFEADTPDDTITGLNELLPGSQPTFSEPPSGLVRRTAEDPSDNVELNPWTGEPDFIAANADEDLLDSDDLPRADSYWFEVDQNIVDQLDADLSGLEADAGASGDDSTPTDNLADSRRTGLGEAVASQGFFSGAPISIEESFAGFGEDLAESSPPSETPDTAADGSIGVSEGFETTSDQEPIEPLDQSFSSFGDDVLVLSSDASSGMSSDPAWSTDSLEEESVTALGDAPSTADPGKDEKTVEAVFEAFGTSSPDKTAGERLASADESAELFPPDRGNPMPPGAPSWQEPNFSDEEDPMPIGDLPSQETVEALFSELNLELGPDEPAVGESGLTLDALESLASSPEPAGATSPLDASGPASETLPPPQPIPPPSSPESTSTPAGEKTADSTLTIENLLGELKLEPLFPETIEAPQPPEVTPDNLFGDEPDPTASPPSTAPSLGEPADQLITPIPKPIEPAPAEAGRDTAGGIDLFGEADQSSPMAPTSFEAGGIDLFGEPPAAEPTPGNGQNQDMDLFGEMPPAEPIPEVPQDQGIDLFDAPRPAEQAAEASQRWGIDLFGETSPDEPSPNELTGDGIDLFGESKFSQPVSNPESDVPSSSDGIDLFSSDDSPPITVEDLDLTLGDTSPEETRISVETPLDESQEHRSEQVKDLFGEPFQSEPLESALSGTAEDLFSEGFDDTSSSDTAEDLFSEGFDDTSSSDTAEDLFSEGFGDTSSSDMAEDLFSEGSTEVSGEEPVNSSGQEYVEVKYTEWLSDISLETILGTSESLSSSQPESEASDASIESPTVSVSGAPDQRFGTEVNSENAQDQEPLGAVVEPPPAESEQDGVNLDALLDQSLDRAREEPDELDSSDLIQDFDPEVEFIDLDALLAEPPPGTDDERLDQPFENIAALTRATEDSDAAETADSDRIEDAEDALDLKALNNDAGPEDAVGPADAEPPQANDLTEETFLELPTLDDLPQPIAETDYALQDDAVSGLEIESDTELEPLAAEVATDGEVPPSIEPFSPDEDVDNLDAEDAVLPGLVEAESPSNLIDPGEAAVDRFIELDASPDELSDDEVMPAPAATEPPLQTDECYEPEAEEPPMPVGPGDETTGLWFLGLDIGAQGISAVLLQRRSGQVFPLYWVDTSISGATADKFFRLPTLASVGSAEADYTVQSVGSSALMVNWDNADTADSEDETILLKSLKPFLKMGMPLNLGDAADSQPRIQWSDNVQLPLQTFATALQELLTTLLQSMTPGSQLTVGAIGLSPEDITAALQDLQGVVVSYPANWPDTYPFNIREAILESGLIDCPDDIYFLEDAIAAVLSGLPDPVEPPPSDNGQPVQQQTLYACHWTGGTVVISAGATVTEMGIANLPQDLGSLTYQDFALHSMAYAGDAIDLDIICHLLHPPERRQPRNLDRYRGPDPADGWSWQAAMPELDTARWDDLDLDSLEFPRAAEPDLPRRYRLQQRLESSLLGQSLLEAVRHLKIILQHQPQFDLELADQRWIVRSKDLEDRIILPFIQRINGHLNKLLSEVGLTTQGINQVICTGGSASLPKISRWLRQKFPNATIIQDTYHSDRPPSCSRIAYGLVNLLRYPQVLDLTRHQYSDMFLLMELLRTFPEQPMPLSGILHLLQERGVNTEACELHLIALLEGRLPPGLLPATNNPLVRVNQSDDARLQALLTTPLFSRPNNQVYVPNLDQGQRLRAYMEALLADKQQDLMDPLLAKLMSVTV